MKINTNIAKTLGTMKESNYLSVGINEDVVIVSAKTEISKNNSRFIEVIFEKDGKTFNHTEWEPTKSPTDVTGDALANKLNSQVTRYDHILKCFYPEDSDRQFVGEDYAEYANWVVSKLNSANKEIKLRIKLVYNDKGYIALPKYLRFSFIEPMSVEKSTMAILSFDKLVKPVVADKEEVSATNPFATGSSTMNTPMTNPNDLPFY